MDIKRVGVVGCGIMGSGIAQVCATHGYEVLVHEVDEGRLKQGLEKIKSRLQRDVERSRLSQERYERALRRLAGTVDIKALADRDIIIEAAPEDLATKQDIFG